MKQYNAIKRKYPKALLLFRVGDFYETFGDDAVRTAGILDIVLTKRGNGSESETALAGFPHHALNTYLPKLVKAGERVAICDQLEDPKKTKTIVKRGVTELITPGVALNDEVLTSKANNFLCAIHFDKNQIGIAFLDISTGEFLIAQGKTDYIDKLLQNFKPSEVLISKPRQEQFKQDFGNDFHTFYIEDWVFKTDYAQDVLLNHFHTASLKGFGINDLKEGIIASGCILHYLRETQHHKLQHITSISRIAEDDYVWMDKFTVRNLELYHSNSYNAITLLHIIDKTHSPMGGRLLKRWLALPLKNIDKIKQRHDVVTFFKNNDDVRQKTQNHIKHIADLERLVSKIATGKINPREVILLKNALEAIVPIKALTSNASNESLKIIGEALHDCDILRERIKKTLHEDAPIQIIKGGVIAPEFSTELDELRHLSKSGKAYLDDMLKRESEQTGITSLKIASNNVFGYYIEVRNTHKDKVPENWIRKQTLVNAERYVTEELKTYEAKILGAEERIYALEQRLFEELTTWMHQFIKIIQHNASLIAKLDCLCGFAQLAIDCNYTRPEINDTLELQIIAGRHPVIEQQLSVGDTYIANDVFLDDTTQQIIMITGPNMSGKSAILRQTALIVLLAQMGSFVPADHVKMGVVDKIFTRVGASDNISMGESTFMVEMNETASILNNISNRSLVLLDEIGRGTSTYDGISIAWSITKYLHEHNAKPKTLFATHYHELNDMTALFQRIKNFNVSVKELENDVLFLRKLVPGGSAHSFGIHVAKMSGMPKEVLDTAKQVLKKLEQSHTETPVKQIANTDKDLQLSFFKLDDPLLEDIKDQILNTDIETLTPVEALMKLHHIKEKLTS